MSAHPFKSEAARERYHARIQERTAAWPVPFEERWVENDWGRTFVRVSGPTDAPPLVLFAPTSCHSLFYAPNIADLAAHHRVYAVDHIYDFGLSVNAVPLRTPDDLLDWLQATLDGLGLDQPVDIVGTSYGAWMTAMLCLRAPHRVRRSVWIAPPATLGPFPAAWIGNALGALIPHRYFLRRMLHWMFPVLSSSEDEGQRAEAEALFEDAWIAMRSYKLRQAVAPTVLTDEELASIEVPTLVLIGELEVLHDPDVVLERLRRVAPGIQAEKIEGAGHDLTLVQAEQVDRKVLAFLEARP